MLNASTPPNGQSPTRLLLHPASSIQYPVSSIQSVSVPPRLKKLRATKFVARTLFVSRSELLLNLHVDPAASDGDIDATRCAGKENLHIVLILQPDLITTPP